MKLHAPAPQLVVLQCVLHGRIPVQEALASCDSDERDAIVSLLDGFDRQGLLASSDATTSVSTDRAVHVEGDGPIASSVVALLAPQLTVSTGPVDGVLTGIDMLISCAGWLPDARWREVDRLCVEHELPWHMCYAEGAMFYVGPCSLPGRTATYADTRARRLAAAGSPDELEFHWSYLDRGDNLPAVEWPSAGGCALVAGILAADALAHLSGGVVPTEGYQLGIDPARSLVRRHPVLALPQLDVPPASADDAADARLLSGQA